ncbi:MAG: hypothetical protein K0S33_2652 [Bacteroidetes bacterium]|jgi:hypothetical protein|nr:hypothetical protein [Bacteroidota bacterium]
MCNLNIFVRETFFVKYAVILFFLLSLAGCEKQPVTPSGNPVYPGTGTSSQGDLRTVFSNDWDNWTYSIDSVSGSFRTVFSNDWDNWNITANGSTMSMRTVFSEDWDNWQLSFPGHQVTLKTVFAEDWDNWELKDYTTGDTYSIKTTFSNDWDNWTVYRNGTHVMDMRTDFSNDFDNWYTRNYGVTNNLHKSCLLFIPVFVGAIHQQGIIQ